MSKGYILTEFPEHCRECEYFGYECRVKRERCHYYNQNGKPGWCPIQKLPDKKDVDLSKDTVMELLDEVISVGYNICLDDIQKGGGK